MLKRRPTRLKSRADFAEPKGYPCGKRFIPRGFKCWTDPKTGRRLKVPINYQIYRKIQSSKGKAADKYYKQRAEDIKKKAFGGNRIKSRKQTEDELNKVKAEIDKQYWLSSRSTSPNVKPPKQELYDKRRELERKLGKKEVWERTQSESKALINPEAHKRQVKKALERGEKVPDNVLKDYPDLVEEAKSKKEPEKKIIKPEDVKSAATREAYTKQELEEAKRSGDKQRVAAWEKEAKRARMANLKTSQNKQKQTQQELFDPLAYDDTIPLLKGLYQGSAALKRRQAHYDHAEFAGGWQCGKTFIPRNRKCYTDPKTGLKTKIPLNYKEYTRRRAEVYKAAQRGQLPDTEYERNLLKSVENRQAKLARDKDKLELAKAAASVGAKQVLPSGIAEVDVNKLKVDPKRFQYKILGASTSSGSVGSLEGVKKWDANLAGVIQVWQDPKDKQVYVINGHNRTERAKKLGVEKITAKFIKAKSPEEARAVGALTNIAEGRGNAQDAAKFFRDSGLTKEDLDRKGIPMREKVATDGIALSKLSDSLFDRVVQGSLPEQRAVTIGSSIKDYKQQQELINLIEKEEKRGRKINKDTISELADMVTGAPTKQEEQGGLFDLLGFTPETRSLALEKAQLQASIKKQLSREKKLFGTVGKSRAADELAKAGNKINVDESAEISETAAKALEAFDKEKSLSGATSRALNAASERIANGENAKKVEKEVYDEILAELQKTYRFGKGSGSRVAKRRITGDERMAASSSQENVEFGRKLKRRLKRRKRCGCRH